MVHQEKKKKQDCGASSQLVVWFSLSSTFLECMHSLAKAEGTTLARLPLGSTKSRWDSFGLVPSTVCWHREWKLRPRRTAMQWRELVLALRQFYSTERRGRFETLNFDPARISPRDGRTLSSHLLWIFLKNEKKKFCLKTKIYTPR